MDTLALVSSPCMIIGRNSERKNKNEAIQHINPYKG